MSESEIEAAAERLASHAMFRSGCEHAWNCHKQCQWCHSMQRDVDVDVVAKAYLSRLAADRAEREERAASRAVVEYALTCDRENTDEWMEGFAERINAWATVVGESDRVRYDAKRGQFRVLKGGA